MGKTAITSKPMPRNRGEHGVEPVAPLPGLLLVHQDGEPLCSPLPLSAGQLELGRGRGGLDKHIDPRMSRRHAHVHYDGRAFFVEDLGSQNGTFVDALRMESGRPCPGARVLRTGDSLFLFCADLRPYQSSGVQREDDVVKGPALQLAYEQAQGAARLGNLLHLTGESGVGKEGVARAAHAASAHRDGPFIAVNCATITESVAERLLFGTRRGAYSGAVADADGYVQAASGGTLFLDEIAELPLSVQAKLLRVVETRDVLPVGANKPVPVQLQLYTATHKNLRTEAASGRFREDLYYRINRPRISLPSLRQRLEEYPWLIELALKKLAPRLTARTSLIELCLLRYWPGNVRELLAEVRTAGLAAMSAKRSIVELDDLCEDAGRRLTSAPPSVNGGAPSVPPAAGAPLPAPAGVPPPPPPLTREDIAAVLRSEKGNISRTARALGLHRTQLKRFMQRFGLTASIVDEDTAE